MMFKIVNLPGPFDYELRTQLHEELQASAGAQAEKQPAQVCRESQCRARGHCSRSRIGVLVFDGAGLTGGCIQRFPIRTALGNVGKAVGMAKSGSGLLALQVRYQTHVSWPSPAR